MSSTTPMDYYATKITFEIDKVTVEFLPQTYNELNELIEKYRLSTQTASDEK